MPQKTVDDFYCPVCKSAPLITDYCPNCSRLGNSSGLVGEEISAHSSGVLHDKIVYLEDQVRVWRESYDELEKQARESENIRKGVEAGLDCANAELGRIRQQLAAFQKDAERYRWLRSWNTGPSQIWELVIDDYNPPYMMLKIEEELDAAIDAAMKGGE